MPTTGTDQMTAETITQAALRVVRAHGLDGLTMRRLSTELGCSLGAAYYHVPSKDALLELMIDSTMGSLPTPGPEAGDWADRIDKMLVASWQMFARYPGIETLRAQGFGQRHADRLRKFTRARLRDAGIAAKDLPAVEALIAHFGVGVAVAVSRDDCDRARVISTATNALHLLLDALRTNAAAASTITPGSC